MPEVSVIIPTFNREIYVCEAIESVLSQSFKDFELIVVDDGSTDNTAGIISRYRHHIAYYYQENKGPSAARNFGIKIAQGEYISFLDSDDLWHHQKLKHQVDLIHANPEIKICYTDEIWIRNGVRVNQKKIHQKYSGWIFPRCLPLCIISPSSVLIQRDVFKKVGTFDKELIVCEDYDLWLRMSAIYPIYFLPEPLIIKRGGHDDQLSKRFWGMDRFRIRALEKILAQNSLNDADRFAAIQELQKKCDILVAGCLKRNKIEEANQFRRIAEKYIPN